MPDAVSFVRLGVGDGERVRAAAHLFDEPPTRAATESFLGDSRHHLLIAYVDAKTPVGFATGIEVMHPDKGLEMMVYELGVDDPYRRRGIGRELVRQLAALAWQRGCTALFALTERNNRAAVATYEFGDVEREDGVVSFTWRRPGEPGDGGALT